MWRCFVMWKQVGRRNHKSVTTTHVTSAAKSFINLTIYIPSQMKTDFLFTLQSITSEKVTLHIATPKKKLQWIFVELLLSLHDVDHPMQYWKVCKHHCKTMTKDLPQCGSLACSLLMLCILSSFNPESLL